MFDEKSCLEKWSDIDCKGFIMLHVKVLTSDNFYSIGLSEIANEIINDYLNEGCREECFSGEINIVFGEVIATIEHHPAREHPDWSDNEAIKIHVPFVSRGHDLSILKYKIRKIVNMVRGNNLNHAINKEYEKIGLKKKRQLSENEFNIICLIGRECKIKEISKMLNRSERTVTIHYHNAKMKMDIENRIDFIKCASYIVNLPENNKNIICL